jgi:hypothetical protein
MSSARRSIGHDDVRTVSLEWRQQLAGWIDRREAVPITGAGIAMNFGLPSWFELTDRLCDVLAEIGDNCAEEIRQEPDLLLKAFRATHRIGMALSMDKDTLASVLHRCLYRGMSVTRPGVVWLECVYRLALTSGLYITFNFDTIFEHYVDRVHDKKAVPITLDRVARRYEGQVDSYHIHGLLPLLLNETTENIQLVFDALSYVRTYSQLIDRYSTTLLHVLSNYKCLFMGLSMVDPNLLRLIAMSSRFRDGDRCWGVVFGRPYPELKDVLENWGLAVVDLMGESSNFETIPDGILGAFSRLDNIDFDDLSEKFTRLVRDPVPPDNSIRR